MIDQARKLLGLYQVNAHLVQQVIQDLSPEEVSHRPCEVGNSMLWIIGHLTTARYGICSLMEKKLEHPFGDQFSRGAEYSDSARYPDLAVLLDHWNQVSGHLQSALEEIDESRWAETVEREFPGVEKTVGGAVSFLHFHESYHVGQLAYIRRLLGHSQLVG